MKMYTYSEARQNLATLLDQATEGAEVRIRRGDGTEYALRALVAERSPLEVPSAETGITADEIVATIRERG